MKAIKIGGKIDFLRRNKGLTYGKLASESGVPESTVERILGDQSNPSAENLIRLARTVGLNLNMLKPEDFHGTEAK